LGRTDDQVQLIFGLFLAREISDITGITIKETGEPGKGARFEITVPKGAWNITEKM
jgi:signal transduction histidine kinase